MTNRHLSCGKNMIKKHHPNSLHNNLINYDLSSASFMNCIFLIPLLVVDSAGVVWLVFFFIFFDLQFSFMIFKIFFFRVFSHSPVSFLPIQSKSTDSVLVITFLKKFASFLSELWYCLIFLIIFIFSVIFFLVIYLALIFRSLNLTLGLFEQFIICLFRYLQEMNVSL